MSSPRPLSEIVELIAKLTPAQRRQLFLRLRAAGLFVPTDLQSDRNRLTIATSVRPIAAKRARALKPAAAPSVTTSQTQSPAATTVHSAHPPTEALPVNATAEYRSPVAGRVVVKSADSFVEDSPHMMPPLPGQAPEQPIALVFDGGSRGNPGEGYGSYNMRWPGTQPQTVRLRFGDKVTNNEAEYDTLIAALEGVLKKLTDAQADPKTATLDVRGDSLLVINQVQGKWEVKNDRMKQRRDAVRKLISRFGNVKLTHHDRENSVKTLGH